VAGTVYESELELVILLRVDLRAQVRRNVHIERGEAQVEGNSPPLRLWVLVEGSRG
jgi:hypothetical protein